MGMSSYILDLEDRFCDIVSDAVKSSEHVSEALAVAIKNRDMVPCFNEHEITEMVGDFWNDFWSKYNGR
jgi:hypothetical protein